MSAGEKELADILTRRNIAYYHFVDARYREAPALTNEAAEELRGLDIFTVTAAGH